MKDKKNVNSYSIKNWPESERPRELLLEKGADYISDAGLIAILLRTGIKGKDAVSFAREMLKEFGGLRGLLNAEICDLEKIKGLGTAKIAQFLAVIEICKRLLKEQIIGKDYIESDKDVMDYLSLSMKDLKEEFFKVIYMNNRNIILSVQTLHKGTVNQAIIYPRDVVKSAIEQNACAVICIHNHPGGSLKPSSMDVEITEKLITVCESVGIRFLDHIIIAPSGNISMHEKGYLNNKIEKIAVNDSLTSN